MKSSKKLLAAFAKHFGWRLKLTKGKTYAAKFPAHDYVQVCIRNKDGEALDICTVSMHGEDHESHWRAFGDDAAKACDNYLELLLGKILIMYKDDSHSWPPEYCGTFAETREEFELKLTIYTGE